MWSTADPGGIDAYYSLNCFVLRETCIIGHKSQGSGTGTLDSASPLSLLIRLSLRYGTTVEDLYMSKMR